MLRHGAVHFLHQTGTSDGDHAARFHEAREVAEIQVVGAVVHEGVDGDDDVEECVRKRQRARIGVNWNYAGLGTLEETWFTFSFSPITDESGGVGGLFHPVTEMTGQMLSERRSKTLRDLASRSGKARDTEAAFDLVAQTLAGADLDLPFALIYSLSDDGATARLAARSGLAAGTAASPRTIDLRAPGGAWPVAQVAHTGAAATIEDVTERLGGIAVGPYPEPPRLALALPIFQPGSDRPAAVLIAGVSARLRMSDLYRAFYDMLAAAVGTAITNARAHEDEEEALVAMDVGIGPIPAVSITAPTSMH